MPYPEQGVHLGQALCLLCRQTASPGTLILDLSQSQLTVADCRKPCANCSIRPNPSIWFHNPCYQILENSYESWERPTSDDFREFADAVKVRYNPPDKEKKDAASVWEGLFSSHTRCIIEDSFRQELFRRLPAEIQAIICDFIGPCWFLIVLGETRRLIERLRNIRGSNPGRRLNLSQEIYTIRTIYQGNSYISRVGSMSLESRFKDFSDREHLILPANIRKIVLSTDHIGVRRIQFLDENSDPSPDGSPWYEIIEVPTSCTEAHVTYDGLFVRNIRVLSNNPHGMSMTWSSPSPPKFQPWNIYRTRDDCRLHYVKIGADLQGLVVCCCHAMNIGIHGFSGTSKAFKAFVNLMRRRSSDRIYWFFFPINVDESIQGAWIRGFKDIATIASNPALVIKTSQGRTITFGPHPPADLQHIYDFHSLVKVGDGFISGIFHDGLDPASRGISEIGVTCDRRRGTNLLEAEPRFDCYTAPAIPPRGGSPATSWYLTKAPLEGLLKVRVCRDQEKSHQPCIGLLLYYKNQQIESLGQIRWDQKLSDETFPPIRIQSSNIDEKNYIKHVQTGAACSGLNSEDDGWQEIPEAGTIVWWFGHLGDRIIIYNE